MKNKKLLALLLAVILLLTQFSMLCMVSAETTALTGRTDFEMGVAVHKGNGYDAYKRPYNVILDAASLGSSLVRIDSDTDSTDAIIAQIAEKNGMDVMFVTSIGLPLESKNSFTTAEYQTVYNKFYSKATALKDYDAYIQLGNELDSIYYTSGGFYEGTSDKKFGDVTAAAIAIYAANKAVKDANAANGSNIKTIVNFSYNHYGFLKALKKIKIDASTYTKTTSADAVYADWDIIGLDYYSNMADDTSYSSILSGLNSEFDKNVIICEANLTPESKSANGTINYAKNVAWLETFVNDCYTDTNVLGFVAYELYDQPALEGSSFNAEAHFGLIDKDGNKKDSYNALCTLYGGDLNADLAKNRTIPEAPAYPTYANTDILKGVVSSEWSPVYSGTPNNLYVDLTASPIDLSDTANFEFDIYIEDYDAFAKAIAGKRINFAFSSDDNKSNKCARYDIANQITKSGWNHIVLGTKLHWNKDSGFAYESIKWALIYFQDGGNDFNPIAGSKAAIANICGVKDEINSVPVYPSYATVFIEGGRTYEGINYYHYLGDKKRALEPNVDVSSVSNIEFDFYIGDYDKFVNMINGHPLRFVIETRGSKTIQYDFTNQITKSGWNHVILTKKNFQSGSDPDFAAIKSYSFKFINDSSSNQVANPNKSTVLRVANICGAPAEIDRVPAYPEYATVFIEGGRTYEGINYYHYLGDKKRSLEPNVDVSSVSNIEFDFYAGDYDKFVNMINGHPLRFVIETRGSKTIQYDFTNQITKSGWNHVILTKKNFQSGSDPDFAAIKSYSFKFINDSSSNQVANPNKSTVLRVANICAAPAEIDRAPAYPEYANVFISTGRTYEGCDKYHYFTDKKVNFEPNIDISAAELIEFDLYIGDYDKFVSMIDGHPMRFTIETKGSGKVRFEFTNQITKSGWNHIIINRSNGTVVATPNYASIKNFYFEFINDSGSNAVNNPNKSTIFRITNVCGALKEINRVPAYPDYPTIFIEGGRTYDNIDYYHYYADKKRDVSADISKADYIEFDFFIGDYDKFVSMIEGHPFYFVLRTKNTNNSDRAVYEFTNQITKSGWNHIKLAKNETIVNESADFSNVAAYNFAFWKDNGNNPIANPNKSTSFRIANLCASYEGGISIPDPEVTTDKIDFIGLGLENVKFDGEGYSQPYDFDEPIDISATRMMELDVYVLDDAVTEMSVELYDEENYAVYEFKNLTAGWNHLAIRLSDNSGDEIELVEGFSFVGAVNESIHVANLYVADYVDGDANRDGKMDLKDLVRMKKYTADIASEDGKVGNVIAMDLSGNDYEVDSTDLSAFRTNILNVK